MSKIFETDRHHKHLLETAVRASIDTRREVVKALERGTGQRHPTQSAPDGKTKQMLAIDQAAEDRCIKILTDRFGDEEIRVLGEESLWPEKFRLLDLSKQHLEGYGEDIHLVEGPEKRMVAIVDMIDGSDLVERNLGNWCAAMIFFKPWPIPKILFSMVHHADGRLYGADGEGTFLLKCTLSGAERLGTLKGPEKRKLQKEHLQLELPEEVRQIAICFYAQKYQHLTTVPPRLSTWLRTSPAADRIRIYNLAGNPMMARLANGENIHVVFEHRGQFAHDAAPGAYIGLRSGAHLVNFDGANITIESIAQYLMKPSASRFQYVLASTEELALQVAGALDHSTRMHYLCKICGAEAIDKDFSPPDCCSQPMLEHDRRGLATL